MCETPSQSQLWEDVLSFAESNQIDFSTLEGDYDIGKLEL